MSAEAGTSYTLDEDALRVYPSDHAKAKTGKKPPFPNIRAGH